jgi:hypothetical protein
MTIKDSFFFKTALLISFDAAPIIDDSAVSNSLLVGGNAAIDQTKSVFGSASLYTTNGYIRTLTGNNAFKLEEDFTVECWLYYQTALVGYPTLASIGMYSDGILLRDDFYINGVNLNNGFLRNNTIPDQWNHVALVRHNGVITLYVGGVSKWTSAYAGVINSSGSPVMLGASLHSNGGENWNGWIEEFRLTNGLARYTANFSVPTAPFPKIGLSIVATITENIAANDFEILAYGLADKQLHGSAIAQSGDTAVNVTTADAVFVVVTPKQGGQWQASTAYALNDFAFPTNPSVMPYYYKRVAAGASGATEPAWTTIAGTRCNDGGITDAWECVGRLTQPITQGPLVPS